MSTNTIRLICPSLRCRAILTAPAAARGKAVRCGQCGMRVKVPDAAAPVKAGPAAAAAEPPAK
ncbi:MAG: hypothetical protein NTW19_04390 [Planctomycetota bacterium]|nr:hypothetical protein [Planctomycetota bacterium]